MIMEMNRRDLLQKLGTAAATVAATGAVSTVAFGGLASAEEPVQGSPAALGMLYDATRCIGCQSCVAACAQANNLRPDTRRDPLHQAPVDLNNFTKNIIKLYKPTDGKSYSYVKQQCMHCVDPACIAGCMFKGLKKDAKTGVVTWNGALCVGCRYCEISCPFHIPKFRWDGFNPEIVKCELCKERLAKGKEPACTSVCPAHAVIFGTRTELLKEAKRRIAESPGKYYQDRVYGEKEAGGTQVIYLSHVPFQKLGLPDLAEESVPQKYLKWQKRLYSYLVLPIGLYATIVGVVSKNWKDHREHLDEQEKITGLRPQL
jgi:Fe-S-cluster-containing dehydrogenase component